MFVLRREEIEAVKLVKESRKEEDRKSGGGLIESDIWNRSG